MKQPTRNRNNALSNKKKIPKQNSQKKRWHPKFGTSKLEEDFARDFLDRLGVKYSYQFEAKEIGRFYDFAIFINGNKEDLSIGNILIIEIDGNY